MVGVVGTEQQISVSVDNVSITSSRRANYVEQQTIHNAHNNTTASSDI